MKSKILLLVFCTVSFFSFASEEIKGKVTSVIDGNTIEITLNSGEKYKVLLHGIDCPDLGQNFAENARTLLQKLLLNKNVTIVVRGKDRMGNRLGDIRVEGVPDPKRELIRTGLAWTTEQNDELESLKEHARVQGLGLWSDANPTPPWIFRRQQSMLQSKSS